MKSAVLVVVALSVLGVAGCASTDTSTPEPEQVTETIDEVVTPEPEPEPAVSEEVTPEVEEPAAMAIEEAADLYLTAICPTNEYIDVFNEKMDSWVSSQRKLSKADKELFAAAAEESRLAANLLDEPPAAWPEGTAEGIDEVVVSLLQDVSKYQSAADSETQQDAYLARYAVIDGGINSNSQAQLVRLRLELPAADAEDDGCGPYKKLAS